MISIQISTTMGQAPRYMYIRPTHLQSSLPPSPSAIHTISKFTCNPSHVQFHFQSPLPSNPSFSLSKIERKANKPRLTDASSLGKNGRDRLGDSDRDGHSLDDRNPFIGGNEAVVACSEISTVSR